MTIDKQQLKFIIEGALMAAGQPLAIDKISELIEEDDRPSKQELRTLLTEMQDDDADRAVELKQLASGYCFQVKQEYAPYIAKLWQEKPARYSRALLETIAIIAYRQPVTRADIEEIRGVAVSTHIIRTLEEREWVKVLGHRDVPGKPAIFGTTKAFLDYFNLKSLEELPTLQEIRDLDQMAEQLNPQLELDVTAAEGSETDVEQTSPEIAQAEETSIEAEEIEQTTIEDGQNEEANSEAEQSEEANSEAEQSEEASFEVEPLEEAIIESEQAFDDIEPDIETVT